MKTSLRRSRGRSFAWAAAFVFLLVACRPETMAQGPRNSSSAAVVTTAPIAQWMATELLAGVSQPELLFERYPKNSRDPLPSYQANMLGQARVVLAVGGTIDANAREAIASSPNGVTLRTLAAGGNGDVKGFEWLVPDGAIATVRALATTLAKDLPTNARTIDENADRLAKAIGALDADFDATAAALAGTRVVLDDPRLEPFAKRAGLEVVYALELKPDLSLTPEQRERLARESSPPRPARLILVSHPDKKEALGEAVSKHLMTMVFVNPMHDPVVGTSNYVETMRRNLVLLRLGVASAEITPETDRPPINEVSSASGS